MPRKKKSAMTKAKEKRLRMRQRRSKTNVKLDTKVKFEDMPVLSPHMPEGNTSIHRPDMPEGNTSIHRPDMPEGNDSIHRLDMQESNIFINWPDVQESNNSIFGLGILESNTSINCPHIPESNNSINCPDIPESNTSINCSNVPESDNSINSPNIPESNTSRNCSGIPESNNSINCPDIPESNTSINCPDIPESNNSINCPDIPESNTSRNCSGIPESNNSINCPDIPESNNSINCPAEGWASQKTTELEGWTSQKTTKLEGWASQKTTELTEFKIAKMQKKHAFKNKKKPDIISIESKVLQSNVERTLLKKNEHLLIQGSFHQGHEQFGINSGKQCVANSLSAVGHSKLKNIVEWNQSYLDSVLITGNQIYTDAHGNNNYLLLTELPKKIKISGVTIRCVLAESIISMINVNIIESADAFLILSLEKALQKALSDSDGCFICVSDFTFIIIKQDGKLYLFDSHSRNSLGLPTPDGRSIILELKDMQHVYQHCVNFVQGQTDKMFEITGISIYIDNYLDKKQFIQSEVDSQSENLVEENSKGLFTQNSSDVEISLESEEKTRFEFTPLTVNVKRQLCTVLKLSSKYIVRNRYDKISNMGDPKTTLSITGDGNCLFRAISYSLSNRQKFYQKVRSAIVRHMEKTADVLATFLRPQFKSVKEHIETLGMEKDNTWGTELEILAASDLLNTDIFTFFNESWIRYSPSQIDRNSSNKLKNESIYLKHTGNHYEVVTSVFAADNSQTEQTNTKQMRNPNKRKAEFLDTESQICTSKKNSAYELANQCVSKTEKEKHKYQENQEIRDRKKSKYHFDTEYKENIKKRLRSAYCKDDEYKLKRKQASIQNYTNDEKFREIVKQASRNKYQGNEDFRESVKMTSKQKYDQSETHKMKIKQQTSMRRNTKKETYKHIDSVIKRFQNDVKKGPEYVCACCFRLFFEAQVICCKKEIYQKDLYQICISDQYLHRCNESCKCNCAFLGTSRTDLWICYTCHRKLLKGYMPADSFSNNLDLETIPIQLKCLNTLEQHLIALNIPFMKILCLPKGGQKGVHGPVVCVPSDIRKITNALPRSEDENLMLKVKLKRKICYKGYEEYQFVNSKHLQEALSFLKNTNSWYSDVVISDNWLNPIPEKDEGNDTSDSNSNIEEINREYSQELTLSQLDEGDEMKTENVTISYLDEKLQGIQLDTCLQPADIGQEALDLCFDQIFEISPAEGNSPISLLQGEGVEAKTFPVHFPTGKNTFSEERNQKLTLGRYFNLRLLSVENRFARDTSYLFFSQYLSELSKVISNVQISLRKETAYTADNKKITANMLCNKETLKKLFKKDEAIKFMKPIRGTPPYWQAAQKDIFAMIRQLGIPQFFCSFSSADFRWPEIVETIMRQQGDTRKSEDLTWNEKCKILCSNPVSVARMFDHRFHKFLTNVIMSDAEPIGKVVDYFYRVEFQQRGSPHTHCLFWVKSAPKFDEDDDVDVISFIDKYITCEIPEKKENPELHDIVMAVHQHSKRHSTTCRKKGTVCRFNFPRPPSEKTFIARPDEGNEEDDVRNVKQQLSQLWEVVQNNANENASASDLLRQAGLTQTEFEKCFRFITKRNTVVLKRRPQEIFTNQYNKHLLRAWNANMDIQFVLDAYSCVVYIISYISKAERELGMLLQLTKTEAYEGNLTAQESMKKVGAAYLHHREISAQEAVFRVTGLRLKECSRKVAFIPIGENPYRLSIPLKQVERKQNLLKVKKQSDTDEGQEIENKDDNIWMTNMVERYKARPNLAIFHKMCLARFCSEFNVVVESQLPSKINPLTTFKLDNNLGYIRQRTRTSPAVIRYPRFSTETAKEKYYQSILQLFLPYMKDSQLKPSKFQTFESFYETGKVILPGEDSLLSVKQIVDGNMSHFVKDGQKLEEAERIMEEQGPQEDAWCELCPETELDRRECLQEGNQTNVIEDEQSNESIPDLHKTNTDSSFKLNVLSSKYPKNEIDPLLRKLNSRQRQIFYQIREWCIKRKNGHNPEPFHVFITGGAGTGKSLLIKCIYYEATRLLATTTDNPDDLTVLLTAPTGTAAFNISGMTIHSALGIFRTLSADHATLSEDKINTLRSKLENLQILIIDEISMVNKRLLFFIHERLRQVKKMSERCPFGGVSVMAVGDFYQLPPVKSKHSDKLYVNDRSNPLNQFWNELFTVVELTEIMRQREDVSFAELLNRLRLKSRSDKLSEADMHSLQQCIRDGPKEVLHIFSTNKELQSYNDEMIFNVCSDPKLIEAEDYDKDKTSGKLVKRKSHFMNTDICLPSSILLAEGARVMLIKNEDVQDGLVNGVMGTVTSIESCSNTSLPETIFIHFDIEIVGKNSKLQKIVNQKRSVGIKPSSEDVPFKSGVRRQYPLKLAWACTVHKVQGLTVEECVVDLNKCFTYGQAYVALSRVTCKDGLYIQDIEAEKLHTKIYCDPDIDEGVSAMPRFLPIRSDQRMYDQSVKILYHNIQGLHQHEEDLKHNAEFRNTDLICLTETWLDVNSNLVEMEGYTASHMFRSLAFDDSCAHFKALKEMQHGGVSVFNKSEIQNKEIIGIAKNIECVILKIISVDTIVATIYKTQRYHMEKFMESFKTLLTKLYAMSDRLVIVGDFNQDILTNQCSILNFMSQNGFRQLVENSTTEGGTLIDHVYVKGCTDVSVSVVPTYYSYHEAVQIVLKI